MANEQTIQMRLKMISDFSDVVNNVSQIEKALGQLKVPTNLKNNFTGIFSDLTKETTKYQRLLDSGFKTKKDVTGLEASGERIDNLLGRLITNMNKIDPTILKESFQIDTTKITEAQNKIAEIKKEMAGVTAGQGFQNIAKGAQDAANEISKISKTKLTANFMEAFKAGDIEAAKQALAGLQQNVKRFKDTTDQSKFQGFLVPLQEALAKMQGDATLQNLTRELQNAKLDLANIDTTEFNKLVQAFQQGKINVEQFRTAVRGYTTEQNRAVSATFSLDSQIKQLGSRVAYFFGLTNSVQLFKRAVTSALNTVKELDATMTEAAVVTNFSVGDMWNKLPQYSRQAQELGVSINGLYQATTLYYQQGLKTNEAMQLGIETMKMGKIAGIDSAEATTAMTSALRGFNMELEQASATKVSDVYSKLAAMSASNTSQIATAMEKTASIAASANMEFETTAALLAQIIETTQEAPETAGTAMKTIIARFSEVKSLRSQGKTTGEDSEGEAIDVNRIQTALRTVGISMDGFFAGTEGLDSILLKLAEKWGTLDFETQRYIATMAAGSRQQSRFIAMMSDYGRTTELVTAANNSAGASQLQYGKTLDSMESKLQRLKNAWNEFLMNLSNNTILKAGVDILTFVIDGINKLNGLISGGNGLTKSIASLITVVSGLAVGKRLLTGMLGGFAQEIGLVGKKPAAAAQTDTQKIEQSQQQSAQRAGEIGQQAGQDFGQQYVSGAVSSIQSGQGQIQQAMQQAGGVTSTQGGGSRKKFTGKISQRTSRTSRIGQVPTKDGEKPVENKPGENKPIEDETAAKNGLVEANKDVASTQDKVTSTTQDATIAEEKHTKTIGEVTGSMRAVGGAMMGVGALLGILATAFEKMGNTKAAEVISVIAAAFMGFGAILTILPSLITAFGTTAVSTGVAVQLAWWWLLVIAAVIVTIIALVYVLCKAFEAASDAAQFEKMSEQLSDLSAAADEAKEKLEAISDTRKALEEMEETFKTLTKGSREWKEALIENNSQVLELLNTYPELAKYIKTGLYGQMEITDAGWDTILETQQQAYANAYTAQTAQAQLVADKSMSMKMEEMAGEAVGKKGKMAIAEFTDSDIGKLGTIMGSMIIGPASPLSSPTLWATAGSIVAFGTPSPEEVEKEQLGLTYDQYADYAAAVAEEGLSFAASDPKELEAVFNKMVADEKIDGNFNEVYASMKKLGEGFDELAQEAHAAKLAEEARVKAIISSNAQASEIVQGSEYIEAIQDFTSQQYENYADLAQEAASEWEYKEGKGTDNAKNAALITAYHEATGMTEDEIRAKLKDESLSYATMAATVGSDEVNKELTESMETLAKGLERVSKGKTKKDMSQITGLMSEGGLGLTRKDLERIQKSGKDLRGYLIEAYGFTAEELTDTQMTILEQNKEAAEKAAAGAYAYSESLLGDNTPIKGIINDLNKEFASLGVSSGLFLSQEQALANALTDVAVRGGDAQETTELFGQMMEGIGSQNAELAQAIIAETDWSDEMSIRSSIDSLRELGAQIDNTLVSEVLQATRATRNFDLKNMTDQVNKAKEVLDMIEGKKSDFSKTYTEEEKNKLKEYGYTDKDFVWAGPDEYIFLGETNALLEDIRTQVTAIADETLKGQRESIQNGTKIEGFLSSLQDNSNFKSWLMGEKVSLDLDATAQAQKAQGVEASLTALRNYYAQEYYGFTEDQISTVIGARLRNGSAPADQEVYDAYLTVSDYITDKNLNLNSLEDDGEIITAITQLTAKDKQDKKSIEWNPTRTELERAAKGFGLTDEEIAGQTDAELKERLRYDVNTYYKNLDKNMKDYFSSLDEASEVAMYQVLGTGDVTGAQKEATGIQKSLTESDAKFYYKTSHGEDREAKDYEKVATSGLELAKLIAQGRVDLWGTGGTENVSEDMLRTLASEMGIEVTNKMGQEELRKLITETFWANFTLDENDNAVERLDVVMDAYIGKHTGLSMAVENSTEQLKANGSAAADDSLAVKNLSVAVHKTGEAMDDLNGVLKDEAELLEINDKNSQQYRSALEKTSIMAQGVFGKQVTAEFVHANRELFIQLTKGGAAAEEAYYKIGQAAVEAEMMAAGYGTELTSKAIAIINEYLASIKPGETIDLTELQNKLNNAVNMTAEASAAMIDFLGFSVSYSVEADSYIATRESAIGTGVNAFDSGDEDVWENPYDKFYNTLRKINETLREREKIERRYQQIVDRGEATANKLGENRKQQLAVLQREAELQNDILDGRKQQISNYVKEKGLSKYGYVEENEYGEMALRINWAEINKVTDSEKGENIEEYISQLEEWFDSIEEAQDALYDIEDSVDELKNRGKDEYLDLEQTIKDALIESYQKQIDKLSEINDSINDTNSKLIDSMQKALDKERQERENEKTRQELEDKQRRLSYLQQDTSGANELEILSLQKELEEGQQSYTDTLIDQKISALQEQNDEAAEQRERQIQIAQQQLEQYDSSGQVWTEVKELMNDGLHSENGLLNGRRLEKVLKDNANWSGLSKQQQDDWATEMNTNIAKALEWLKSTKDNTSVDLDKKSGNNSDFGHINTPTNTGGSGNGGNGNGLQYGMTAEQVHTLQTNLKTSKLYEGEVDSKYGSGTKAAVLAYQKEHGLVEDATGGKSVLVHMNGLSYSGISGKKPQDNGAIMNYSLWAKNYNTKIKQFRTPGESNEGFVNAPHLIDGNGIPWIYGNPAGGRLGTIQVKGKRYRLDYAYKTGGLADYTGPAWLDGTKSRPELVLNAQDTQNFIQLKDILSSIMSRPTKSSEKTGDTTFDIDINIETVREEADLEMISNYIENKITTSANYRNNNFIQTRR